MLQQLINGVMLGLIYGFVALGYTLVFGLLRQLNFAHGEIFMLGAVLTYELTSGPGWPVVFAIAASTLAMGCLGVVLWAVCFLPVKRLEDHMAPALSSFAFGIAIAAIVVKYLGVEPRSMPFDLGYPAFKLVTAGISRSQLLILIVTAIVLIGTITFMRRTRYGRAIRALAERPSTAALMGIPTLTVTASVFFASSALAGLAGAITVLHLGVVSPIIGLTIGLKAVAVMVIGGIGNVIGALVAGILLGLGEVAVVQWANGSLGDALVWGGLMVVLLARPQGLFGQRFGY